MNPILPLTHFVPDVEARVWKDGRLYLYGSYDISGDTTYCSHVYHVFSSDDMTTWTDHGICFRSDWDTGEGSWSGMPLYAPDCVCHDGRYFLFFCLAGGGEGVAVSLLPEGPFKQATPVVGADGNGIDPAVLVDDDGQVYYYWGQFQLHAARLKDDMRSLMPETIVTNVLTEEAHGFHEGACIRKRNGIYYLVYTDISRGRATCLSYATSRSPLGPFVKGGVIIDNEGCDPQTWNNHGSVAEYKGSWYVFYHRSSQGSTFNRRVCVEPILFDGSGHIAEVAMTTQGAHGPLSAKERLEAGRACQLSGKVRIVPDPHVHGTEILSMIEHGDWACFRYLDFEAGCKLFSVEAGSSTCGGLVEIRLDHPDGHLVGTCRIDTTGEWSDSRCFSAPIEHTEGVHALYLRFRGGKGRLFDLRSIQFATS